MQIVRFCAAPLCALLLFVPVAGAAQLTEGFNNIASLPGSGWATVNNSAPAGSTAWFQGTAAVFGAESGGPDSYIAANFNAAAFSGNISLWLITPVVTLDNGINLSFFTRTEFPQVAADRLEVRASTNGSSTNAGSSDTSVGDFTNLLLVINPSVTVAGYPGNWTQFTATISGLAGPVSGRFAFRYSVGDTSTNADYIGIDSVSVSSPVPEPSSLGFGLAGLLIFTSVAARRRANA